MGEMNKCFDVSMQIQIVAKASHGQRYPMPLCECMWMCDGERGSSPEGADDLCLVRFEALSWDLSLNVIGPSVGPFVRCMVHAFMNLLL